jgi:hypothetical protein
MQHTTARVTCSGALLPAGATSFRLATQLPQALAASPALSRPVTALSACSAVTRPLAVTLPLSAFDPLLGPAAAALPAAVSMPRCVMKALAASPVWRCPACLLLLA